MAQPSIRVQRSFSGHHDILPAAESGGTNTVSFVPIHTLFIWTFGSGAVVRSIDYSSPLSHIVRSNSFGGYGRLSCYTPSLPLVCIVSSGPFPHNYDRDLIAVTAISLRTKVDLSIPTVMLTVMGASASFHLGARKQIDLSSAGVVIGFVISYRASSAYDLYCVGRTAWSDVVKNTLTLTRLIWFHVPLRLTPKPPDGLVERASSPSREEIDTVMREKRVALDLLEGYLIL
jgi:hypothetical protein